MTKRKFLENKDYIEEKIGVPYSATAHQDLMKNLKKKGLPQYSYKDFVEFYLFGILVSRPDGLLGEKDIIREKMADYVAALSEALETPIESFCEVEEVDFFRDNYRFGIRRKREATTIFQSSSFGSLSN
jgi:hypothetical protein